MEHTNVKRTAVYLLEIIRMRNKRFKKSINILFYTYFV